MADTTEMNYDELMEEVHKARVDNAILRGRRALMNAEMEDLRDTLRACTAESPEVRERKEAMLSFRRSEMEHKKYLSRLLRDCSELSTVYAYARAYVDEALAAESYETQTRSFRDLVDALEEFDRHKQEFFTDEQ